MNFGTIKLELSRYRDKILFACGFIYFISVLLWLATQGKLKLPFFSPPDRPPSAQDRQTEQVSAADAEFIAYLQRSLAKIEQKEKQGVNSNPVSVKAPPTANSSSPASQSPPTVVERIYVPIYPPNQLPASGGSPPPAAIPALPSPSVKTTYRPIPSSGVPVLTPGAKLLPPPAATPVTGHTLVGLLESSEQSYALFNFNGLTKRFTIGEPVGSSGWVLIAVENEKAILQRSGQKRAIEVGQSF